MVCSDPKPGTRVPSYFEPLYFTNRRRVHRRLVTLSVIEIVSVELVMAGSSRWYFDKRSLADSPSKRCGIEAEEELSYRQQAANLIQEMGQRLKVYVQDPSFFLPASPFAISTIYWIIQSSNLFLPLYSSFYRTQLCINTAIVYMHRFYVFHSITKFRKTVSNPEM